MYDGASDNANPVTPWMKKKKSFAMQYHLSEPQRLWIVTIGSFYWDFLTVSANRVIEVTDTECIWTLRNW